MDNIPPQQKTEVRTETRQSEINPVLAGLVVQKFSLDLDTKAKGLPLSNNKPLNNQQISQTYGERDGYVDNFSQDLNTLFRKFENASVNFYTIEDWERVQCLSVIRNYESQYGYLPEYLRYTQIPEQKSEERKLLEAHLCDLILKIDRISRRVVNSAEISGKSAGDMYRSASYREAFSLLILYIEELNYTIEIRKKVLQ